MNHNPEITKSYALSGLSEDDLEFMLRVMLYQSPTDLVEGSTGFIGLETLEAMQKKICTLIGEGLEL